MKKCPICGNNVPGENNTCNNCGYSFKNKNVFHNINASMNNNGSKGVYKNNNNFGKIFLIIVGISFVFPVIIFFAVIFSFINIMDMFDDEDFEPDIYYTCDMLCGSFSEYVNAYGKCICGDGNIYYSGTGELYYESDGVNDEYNRCKVYCNSEPVNYNQQCLCSNGEKYDMYGNLIIEENIFDTRIDDWDKDILSNNIVTTVFCDEKKDSMCVLYRNIIELFNKEKNTNIYYFDLSKLTQPQKSKLLYLYNINYYDNIPYTFIMKDGKYLTSMIGILQEQALENFLIDNGVM